MDSSRILVLGVAAVQADAILAAQRLGLSVVACAQAPDGPGADLADEFVELSFSDPDVVTDLALSLGVGAVYSVGSDLAMPVACTVSERLGLPRFVSSQVARSCNDKGLMRSVLAGLDSEVPSQVVDAPGVPLELDLPVIVKPADAQGQRGVRRVDDAKNLDEAVRTAVGHSRSGRAIIERYVAGPEVSVNGYLVDGRLAFCAVSDRLTWPQHTGLVRAHVLPADTVAPERHAEIREVLDAAAAALGITNGPVYAQMKVDDRPRVLEVTPRLDGCHLWRAIRAATGVDLLDTTLRHLVAGEVPSAALEQTRSSAATIEFMCAVPGQPVDYSPFATIEEDADEVWHYYEPGDVVRPVNGHYEKVGYTLSCSPVVAESRP